jgi:hypothetical protein
MSQPTYLLTVQKLDAHMRALRESLDSQSRYAEMFGAINGLHKQLAEYLAPITEAQKRFIEAVSANQRSITQLSEAITGASSRLTMAARPFLADIERTNRYINAHRADFQRIANWTASFRENTRISEEIRKLSSLPQEHQRWIERARQHILTRSLNSAHI